VGGVFALLVMLHFCSDWLFQSHAEAMAKAKNKRVRAWHCVKYAAPFVLPFWLAGSSTLVVSVSLAFLSLTHFYIDSYHPTMMWAKHCRKAPQFSETSVVWQPGKWEDKKLETVKVSRYSDEEAFKAFASTSLGLVLVITVDQLFHIMCLLPVAIALTW
jgi:hypothetical protein